jgi:hypothetical protein
VLVSLGASTVTVSDPAFNEYTLSDGTDTLIADDFLFLPNPLPGVGQSFVSLRGILTLRQMVSKLEPRDASDLTVGAPGLASFGPSLSYARVGTTTNAPTFPQPLTVTLTAAAATDTTIVIASGSGALTVANVTIMAGQTSAPVPVTAVAQDADVTLTATLGVQVRTAHVRVLGAAENPTTVTLSPAAVGVSPGGMVTLTVTLDVPAPAGGTTVGLAVNPPTAGTLPATVMVPANETAATFNFTNALSTGSATITATLGGSTSNTMVTVATGPNHVVISQIYGGGGNTGAQFNRDFVELFNPTNAPLPLGGLSIQYASAVGVSWSVTALPAAAIIPPGGYFLVQLQGGATGAALPTPDHTGSTNMSATVGKVALVDGTNALDKACPTMGLVDFIGFGTTANCFEGELAPAGSNTLALKRAAGGCTDTEVNGDDFTAVAPAPRNSATTLAPCL